MQAAQQSSDKLTLQQQLTTAQTDLAAAEQALQELSQKAALASTESQTVEDSKGNISHFTCNCLDCMSKNHVLGCHIMYSMRKHVGFIWRTVL